VLITVAVVAIAHSDTSVPRFRVPRRLDRALPKGLVNQTSDEAEYLGYHKCYDAGEAYGASYLISKEHLILQNTNYSLNWVNCEMASFIMMHQRNRALRKGTPGTIIQSLDVLDFAAIHLSAYERVLRRYGRLVKKQTFPGTVEVVRTVTQTMINRRDSGVYVDRSIPELNRTLVVMPFLGTGMGSGHSVLANRYEYLKACFWSIYPEMPHIVVGVTSQADYDYCRHESGLPFYDVIYNRNLPKGASNPVSTVQQVKARFLNGTYDFDYMFFTESDQVLVMREARQLYDILQNNPRYIIIPHRLMPYPHVVVKMRLKRGLVRTVDHDHGWRNMSCCMQRQNCRHRKDWIPLLNPAVPLLSIYGLITPLGNSNFLDEVYHSCSMTLSERLEFCP